LLFRKANLSRVEVNLSYHARGAYLRPYKERCNLHTAEVGVESKLAGINIFLEIPMKKGVLHIHLV
jgi:hypothetical protein